MKQRSKEWFEARHRKVTGSRIAPIMGISKFANSDDVMRDMIREINGLDPLFKGNIATKWGEDHEADAIEMFESAHGVIVEEHGIVHHPKYEWASYSPDGTFEKNGKRCLLEIKCPFSKRIPAEVPEYYQAQVQWGMEVMDIDVCLFMYWTPDAVVYFTISRDKKMAEDMIHAAQSFMDSFENFSREPEPWLEDAPEKLSIAREDDVFKEATDQWKKSYEALLKAKENLERDRQRLIDLTEGVSSKGFGVSVTAFTKKGTPNYREFFERHPELKDELKTGAETIGFRITAEKS